MTISNIFLLGVAASLFFKDAFCGFSWFSWLWISFTKIKTSVALQLALFYSLNHHKPYLWQQKPLPVAQSKQVAQPFSSCVLLGSLEYHNRENPRKQEWWNPQQWDKILQFCYPCLYLWEKEQQQLELRRLQHQSWSGYCIMLAVSTLR